MPETVKRRVLFVDDDVDVLRTSALILERAGFDVATATNGADALEALDAAARKGRDGTPPFSVVVSDILMEGMSGLDLLRAVRLRFPDLPVVMVTGGPTIATAIEAMNEGAHRYLMKPVPTAQLVGTVTRAALLFDLARVKREALAMQGLWNLPMGERTQLDAAFSRALDSLYMVYQPIVSMTTRRTVGYEALVRTHEAQMQEPGVLFDTASLLARESELSRRIYTSVAERAREIRPELLLFVNVHPPDLLDPSLYGDGSPLAEHAGRVVLEMTERASLDRLGDLGPAVTDLRRLGYRVAVDDLGTGYAGLSSFTHFGPDFVKLDRSLVTGIDRNPTKARVVHAMYSLCADLGMAVISEGVETPAEREALRPLGADFLQGYLFARPTEDFVEPTLEA
ncbi:MAG: EAL domain-containing response regulator [Gemmatimonadota bacterium]|nr:EAL domain-containing response regulator [Gemmatimonadota bacterium]